MGKLDLFQGIAHPKELRVLPVVGDVIGVGGTGVVPARQVPIRSVKTGERDVPPGPVIRRRGEPNCDRSEVLVPRVGSE